MYTRENADTFIAERKYLMKEQYRLGFHLMGEFGWMNDPNGFIYYNGEYHMFYQHYPYQPVWGPMHWGHAVSRDLITWEYLPVALAPDQDYDRDGCFSGSAFEQDGKLYLMYTGHVITGPDKENDYRQNQNIAVSEDGIRFEKLTSNPVIGSELIPADVSQKDFRDPKVFTREGVYYSVIGSNDGQGTGLILLYRSEDLGNWSLVGEIARSDGQLGDNWECPDLFELGEHDVLVMSPQRMPAQGDDYHNLHSATYMVGRLDIEQSSFSYDCYEPIDCGFDFYAPQTTIDDKGRRIIMGWMETWETEIPTQLGHYWAGAMTMPREVVMQGKSLLFKPLEEVKAYRHNAYEIGNVLLTGVKDMEACGDCYELEVVFQADQAEEFGLKLRVHGGEETVLSYRQTEGIFRFNRDKSGIGLGGERRTKVALKDGLLALHIFVDKSSVEIFIQGGEKVMTCRVYPGSNSLGIQAYAEGLCSMVSFKKWDIK
ncbi:glycoside hydrolase family 32 protein [Paenibacillus sp. LHD-38]|uniref:glycoside hydrolase family 32 protein n=1 Tax=Paenibacillus sp. LHD-38 TaxID=3072143 RepID=UPI00280C4182|nr:glycoside hydrolase family 32 protein [Paenibacillus sp. LHD-38]MDQ8734061.1 glycoside hydrolase family 32 protein [Paenibacillus sp. LHD-38]